MTQYTHTHNIAISYMLRYVQCHVSHSKFPSFKNADPTLNYVLTYRCKKKKKKKERIGGFEVIGFYRESQSDKKGFCCAENTVRLFYYGSSVPRKSGLLISLVIYLAVYKEPASVKPSILERHRLRKYTRDSPAVKSPCCSCRGPRFSS